jgi:4-hydroxybenzoate polyprenyltransferase
MIPKLRHYLALVRFSHTLFAMPFALAAMFWAARGWPEARVFALIVLCMVLCRNAAMAFNRLVDAAYDGRNPRTARRHIPAGVLSRRGVLAFFIVNALLFVIATWFLNPLAFALSVPALIAVCFYSLTKRFTSWSHLYLGLAIGISPVGAWVAVTGTIGFEALLLCLVLLLWIAGFDIIYATQDEDFDRKAGLNSVVVKFGLPGALNVSRILHGLMLCGLVLTEILFGLGWSFRIAIAVTTALIVFMHFFRRSASLDDLNADFFQANIAVSSVICLGIVASVFLRRSDRVNFLSGIDSRLESRCRN